MENTKCVSCGHSFSADKKIEQIKVTLNNPGEVFIDGKVTTCPNCKCQSADSEDLKKILEDFDVAYEEKHKNFKKTMYLNGKI